MRIKKSCNIVRSMKNHNMHGLSSVCVYLERQFSFSALRFAVLYAAMRGGKTMCASRVPRYASHSNRGRPQAEEEIMETTQPKARRETSAEFFFHFLFFFLLSVQVLFSSGNADHPGNRTQHYMYSMYILPKSREKESRDGGRSWRWPAKPCIDRRRRRNKECLRVGRQWSRRVSTLVVHSVGRWPPPVRRRRAAPCSRVRGGAAGRGGLLSGALRGNNYTVARDLVGVTLS